MKLIEQLGGYENSKGLLNLYEYSISFKYCLDSSGDFESWVYLDVFVPDLKQALLQYRREHNIFEVGDKVVYLSDFTAVHNDIYEVWKTDRVGCLVVFNDKDCRALYEQIRHATPEEIQAGRRLEVCGG